MYLNFVIHLHFSFLPWDLRERLHSKFKSKKHFSPLTWPNFVKFMLKMLCTNLPFILNDRLPKLLFIPKLKFIFLNF